MFIYHRGDPLFLYTRFSNASGTYTSAGDVMVRILHENGDTILEDLPWTSMQQLSDTDYSYTWQIPLNTDYGFYEVIYHGTIDGVQAEDVEEFHVIGRSEQYDDTVKVYGYVHQTRSELPIIDGEILVTDATGDEVYRAYTDDGGLWETHVYPGQYTFTFTKAGFNPVVMVVQINSQENELQFDNVVLGSDALDETLKGTGIFTVSDQYITKDGTQLSGLSISAAVIFEPTVVIAQTTTDEDGNWELYLDPGTYLLRITGTALTQTFDKLFRLKVDDHGMVKFEDITLNVATPIQEAGVDSGNGNIEVTDVVLDANNNPILDVTVTATQAGANNTTTTVAETTTDVNGNWTLMLNAGAYTITYNHPLFNEFQESRIIN